MPGDFDFDFSSPSQKPSKPKSDRSDRDDDDSPPRKPAKRPRDEEAEEDEVAPPPKAKREVDERPTKPARRPEPVEETEPDDFNFTAPSPPVAKKSKPPEPEEARPAPKSKPPAPPARPRPTQPEPVEQIGGSDFDFAGNAPKPVAKRPRDGEGDEIPRAKSSPRIDRPKPVPPPPPADDFNFAAPTPDPEEEPKPVSRPKSSPRIERPTPPPVADDEGETVTHSLNFQPPATKRPSRAEVEPTPGTEVQDLNFIQSAPTPKAKPRKPQPPEDDDGDQPQRTEVVRQPVLPAADAFSFDAGTSVPVDEDEVDERPSSKKHRTRGRGRDEVEPSSKSRFGNKKEKKGTNPLLYLGIGAGGMALLAGGIIVGLTMKGSGSKDQEAKDKEKDKGKTTVVAAAATPIGKKDATPANPSADFMTEDVRERVKRNTVYIRVIFAKGGASGSGWVEKSSKLVVTNAHVIGKKPPRPGTRPKDMEKGKEKEKEEDLGPIQQIQLIFNSGEGKGKEFTMIGDHESVKFDPEVDLAVIQPLGLRTASGENNFVLPEGLSVPKNPKVVETQKLFIFGFPLGESLGKEISITDTTVSSLRKTDGKLSQIQVKGGMTNGNSGGPVVDGKGNVVGVAVAGIRSTDINFCIPGESVIDFFKKYDVK